MGCRPFSHVMREFRKTTSMGMTAAGSHIRRNQSGKSARQRTERTDESAQSPKAVGDSK